MYVKSLLLASFEPEVIVFWKSKKRLVDLIHEKKKLRAAISAKAGFHNDVLDHISEDFVSRIRNQSSRIKSKSVQKSLLDLGFWLVERKVIKHSSENL